MKIRTLAILSVLACACGGSSTQNPGTLPAADDKSAGEIAQVALPEIPATPAEAPAELLAELSIGAPSQQLGKLASYMDAVAPGAGALMGPEQFLASLAGTVGATRLDGVDLQKPVWALIHDEDAAQANWVVVVGIADEDALRASVDETPGVEMIAHNGFAAIGSAEALNVGAPYALSNRVGGETAPEVQLTVDMPRVLATHGASIQGLIGGMLRVSPTSQAGIMAVLGEVQKMQATLVVDHNAASVEFQTELSDGILKSFANQQQPASFDLVPQVGLGPWAVTAAGHVDLSSVAPMLGMVSGRAGPFAPLVGLVKDIKGEMAMGVKVADGTPQIAMAVAVADGKALAGIINVVVDALVAQQKKEPLRIDELAIKLKKNGIRGKGANLHQLNFTVAKDADPAKAELLKTVYGGKGLSAFAGVANDKVVVTFGKDAKKNAQRLSKGGADSGKNDALLAVIAGAKERGESILIAIDIAAANQIRGPKDGPPLAIGVAFKDGNASARITMPAEQAREAQRGM